MATNQDNTDLLGPAPVCTAIANAARNLRSRAEYWRDRAELFHPGIYDWKNKANACEYIARELEVEAATIETQQDSR